MALIVEAVDPVGKSMEEDVTPRLPHHGNCAHVQSCSQTLQVSCVL